MAHRRSSGAPSPADGKPQTYTCVRCPCSSSSHSASSADTAGQGQKKYSGHYVCTLNTACNHQCPSHGRQAPYNTACYSPPRYACYTYLCNGGNCTLQNPADGAAEPEAPPEEWEQENVVSDTYIRSVYNSADEKPSAEFHEPEPEPPPKADDPSRSDAAQVASDTQANKPQRYTTHLYVELKQKPSSAASARNPTPPDKADSAPEVPAQSASSKAESEPHVHSRASSDSNSAAPARSASSEDTTEQDSHEAKPRGRFSAHGFSGKFGSKKSKNAKKEEDHLPSDKEKSVSRSTEHKLKPVKKKPAKPRKVKKLKKDQFPM